MKTPLCLLSVPLLATGAAAQFGGFSAQKVITTTADRAQDAYAADLDGDGDLDVLSASEFDDVFAWYENLGAGDFGPGQVIASALDGPESVFAADIDGDGDLDVLTASSGDDTIAWIESLGGGSFGAPQILTNTAESAIAVHGADLDGDGDVDVLFASLSDDTVAWFENLGGGLFSAEQIITTSAAAATDVFSADLDGDGDEDVLSTSFADDKVAWYENLGGGTFGPQQVITNSYTFPTDVHAADLDGDGDPDVLTAARDDSLIGWNENLGAGAFGPTQIITNEIAGARSVYTADFDLDGDQDVVGVGSGGFNNVAWFANAGDGSFGALQGIIPENDPGTLFAQSVFAADLDGDGDPDVLTASSGDDKIAWHANQSSTAVTYGAGCGSTPMEFTPTSQAVLTSVVIGRVTNSAPVCLVSLGYSNTASALGPLPLDLEIIGLPGCSLLQSAELFGLPTQATASPSEFDWTVTVPDNSNLVGVHVYVQAFSFGSAANPSEILVSNGIDWQIGA